MADQSAHAVAEDAERYLADVARMADQYPRMVSQFGRISAGHLARTCAGFAAVERVHAELEAHGVAPEPTPTELRAGYATFLRQVADIIEAGGPPGTAGANLL